MHNKLWRGISRDNNTNNCVLGISVIPLTLTIIYMYWKIRKVNYALNVI